MEIDAPIKPLYVPEHWLTRAESGGGGILFYVPILGNYLYNESFIRPIVDSVNSQLLDRPAFELRAPPNVRTMYAWISQLIRKRIGWLSDRFIPLDPLRLLLWAHRDGLDAEEFCMDLEDHLDIVIGGSDDLVATFPTFGRFVQHVLGNCDERRLGTLRVRE